MAVKVLRIEETKIVEEVRCDCGAVLEYDPDEDVMSTRYPDGHGGMSGESWVRCPACSHRVSIDSY